MIQACHGGQEEAVPPPGKEGVIVAASGSSKSKPSYTQLRRRPREIKDQVTKGESVSDLYSFRVRNKTVNFLLESCTAGSRECPCWLWESVNHGHPDNISSILPLEPLPQRKKVSSLCVSWSCPQRLFPFVQEPRLIRYVRLDKSSHAKFCAIEM